MIHIDYENPADIPSRDEVVKQHTLAVLRACGMNRRRAADKLDMSPRWLFKKLRRWKVGGEYFPRPLRKPKPPEQLSQHPRAVKGREWRRLHPRQRKAVARWHPSAACVADRVRARPSTRVRARLTTPRKRRSHARVTSCSRTCVSSARSGTSGTIPPGRAGRCTCG